MKIADAMNTYHVALDEILIRGYNVTVSEDDDDFQWFAVKDNSQFIASDPLRLLALLVIGENRGEDWNRGKTADHYDRIMDAFYDEL